jgi:hypothetical protein
VAQPGAEVNVPQAAVVSANPADWTPHVLDGLDKLDITPDGAKLIAIGNWTSVAGLRRDQIVMLDLTTGPVPVSSRATTRYQQPCAPAPPAPSAARPSTASPGSPTACSS